MFKLQPGTYFFGDAYWSQWLKKPLHTMYLKNQFPCCYNGRVFNYDEVSIDLIQFHMKTNKFCIIQSPNTIDVYENIRGFVKTFTQPLNIVQHDDLICVSSEQFHLFVEIATNEQYLTFQDFSDMECSNALSKLVVS